MASSFYSSPCHQTLTAKFLFNIPLMFLFLLHMYVLLNTKRLKFVFEIYVNDFILYIKIFQFLLLRYTHTYKHIYVCMYVWVDMHMYMWICVCVCGYVCIYMYLWGSEKFTDFYYCVNTTLYECCNPFVLLLLVI